MKGHDEYVKAILSGTPIQVVNNLIPLDENSFNPPPGMKGYSAEALEAGKKFYGKLRIYPDRQLAEWDEDQVEKDMRAELNRQMGMSRYRSIDEPWEES